MNAVLLESASRFNFHETLEKIKEMATLRGWKILVEHDLQETLRKNRIEVLESKVVELCKPEFAGALMQEDAVKFASALMPCRISIYCKTDGKTYISRINSGMISMFMAGTIGKVMSMAGSEMELIMKGVIADETLSDF